MQRYFLFLFVLCLIPTISVAELSLYHFGYSIVDSTGVSQSGLDTGIHFSKFSYSIIPSTGNIRSIVKAQSEDPTLLENPIPSRFISTNFYCYPNPFLEESGTTIGYSLPENKDITIQIYNEFGHLIFEVNCTSGQEGGMGSPHFNKIPFTPQSVGSHHLSAGAYFVFMIADGKVIGKTKMAVLPSGASE